MSCGHASNFKFNVEVVFNNLLLWGLHLEDIPPDELHPPVIILEVLKIPFLLAQIYKTKRDALIHLPLTLESWSISARKLDVSYDLLLSMYCVVVVINSTLFNYWLFNYCTVCVHAKSTQLLSKYTAWLVLLLGVTEELDQVLNSRIKVPHKQRHKSRHRTHPSTCPFGEHDTWYYI